MFIRRIIAGVIAGVCIALIAPTSAGAADPVPSVTADLPQACNWRYDTVDMNNNHLIMNAGGYRAYGDFRLQRARATGCESHLRNMVNIRCQRWTGSAWVPTTCQLSWGKTTLWACSDTELLGYGDVWSFATSGPDGIITVYSPFWVNIVPGVRYFGTISFTGLTMGGWTTHNLGVRANSHWWPGAC